jgi:predicted amidohydrolase YtcJ
MGGLRFVVDYLHAAGVTTSCEPGGVVSKPLQDAQNEVLGGPEVPFRFYFIPDGKTMAELYLDGDLIGETRKLLDWGAGKTSFLEQQVKLFSDGAIFSQAMQMRDGYLDGHEGAWMIEPDVFERAFATYWDADYQIHIHQNGDAGLDLVIDCLAANLARKPRADHRTTIVHFGFSTEDQVARLAELGAIVSANPYYASALADRYGEEGVGPERADAIARLGDVRRAGISLSLHSDMPMAPGQPLFLMWCAVNRVTMSGRTARPDLRISAEDALRAVTLDAAYSIRLEHEIGSIEVGKKANFTVLDSNPLTVAPETIKDVRVLGTMLEGVHSPVG